MRLERVLGPVLPPLLTEVFLSPLIVLEVVTRAMLESVGSLAWPFGALALYAAWLLRSSINRGEADADEEPIHA